MYDWANYLGDSQSVQKALKDLRLCYVNKNCLFDKSYQPDKSYFNVNMPQSNSTFSNVWDKQDIINLAEYSGTIPGTITSCDDWELDPTYTPQIIYYWNSDRGSGAPEEHGQYTIETLTAQ